MNPGLRDKPILYRSYSAVKKETNPGELAVSVKLASPA